MAGCGGATISDPSEELAPETPSASPPALSPDVLVYPDVSMGAGSIEEGIAALNEYRALAGLQPVVSDAAWSTACLGHLRYLDFASTEQYGGACVLMHDEPDESNPSYAPLHEKAAGGALLACDRTSETQLSLGRSVDRWINSLYHRLPLLDPGLVRVGGASYGGYVCLHYASGTLPLDEPQQVFWPPANTFDVPISFVGRERPCPTTPADPNGTAAEQCPAAGFIMSSTWYGPEYGYPYSSSSAAPALFTDDDGQAVPLLAWYADGVAGHDPAAGLIPRTIAWVPAATLEEGRRYRAELSGESWTFRTGSRVE